MYGQIGSYRYDEEFKKSGKVTIGRIDSIQVNPKREYIYVSYYVDSKKYISIESGLHKKITEKDIGKFYNIKYLSNSPGIIRGVYLKKISDTSEILKSGFSKEDIGNNTRN